MDETIGLIVVMLVVSVASAYVVGASLGRGGECALLGLLLGPLGVLLVALLGRTPQAEAAYQQAVETARARMAAPRRAAKEADIKPIARGAGGAAEALDRLAQRAR